jgi:hypothetical protein
MRSASEQRSRPRFVKEEPFPPYAFVPGRRPHPISDPAGHSFGLKPATVEPIDPEKWRENRAYLRGLDLFNHGYYWEAHEVWESLWHACGRQGATAGFLKGLIQLAAAGVKVREGRLAGVRSHAHRARELFDQAASEVGTPLLGLSLPNLIGFARRIDEGHATLAADPMALVAIVFKDVLAPY